MKVSTVYCIGSDMTCLELRIVQVALTSPQRLTLHMIPRLSRSIHTTTRRMSASPYTVVNTDSMSPSHIVLELIR